MSYKKILTENDLINILKSTSYKVNFKEIQGEILDWHTDFLMHFNELEGVAIENGGIFAYNDTDKYMSKMGHKIDLTRTPPENREFYRLFRDSRVYPWVAGEYIEPDFVRTEDVEITTEAEGQEPIVTVETKSYQYIGTEAGFNNNGRPSLNPKIWKDLSIVEDEVV